MKKREMCFSLTMFVLLTMELIETSAQTLPEYLPGVPTNWHRYRDRDVIRLLDQRLHDTHLRRIHTRTMRRLGLPAGVLLSTNIIKKHKLPLKVVPKDFETVIKIDEMLNTGKKLTTSTPAPSMTRSRPKHAPATHESSVVKFSPKRTQFWQDKPEHSAKLILKDESSSSGGVRNEINSWRSTYLDPDSNEPKRRFQSFGNLTRKEEILLGDKEDEDYKRLLKLSGGSGGHDLSDQELAGLSPEEMEARCEFQIILV